MHHFSSSCNLSFTSWNSGLTTKRISRTSCLQNSKDIFSFLDQVSPWCSLLQGFPSGSVVKNPPAMQEPQVQSLGYLNWTIEPLYFSSLENPMDRGAWRATLHRVTKSWKRLKRLGTHALYSIGFWDIWFFCFSAYLSFFLFFFFKVAGYNVYFYFLFFLILFYFCIPF